VVDLINNWNCLSALCVRPQEAYTTCWAGTENCELLH